MKKAATKSKTAQAAPAKKEKAKKLILGELVDAHWALYQARKAAAAKLKDAEDAEDASAAELLATFGAQKLNGARGVKAQLTVSHRDFVEIKDYTALCRYIRRTGYFDLLHRRVGIEALRDRIKNGAKVPGVLVGSAPSLSLTTLGKE